MLAAFRTRYQNC